MPYSCDNLTLSGAVCYQLLLISHAAEACCRTDLKSLVCMYGTGWSLAVPAQLCLSQAEGFVEGLGFLWVSATYPSPQNALQTLLFNFGKIQT